VNTLGCHRYLAPVLRGRSAEEVERFVSRIGSRHLQEGWRAAFADAYPVDLLEDSERKIGIAVRRIEDTLATSPWLAGSTYSLADIDAFALCNSLPALTPRLVNDKDTPRLLQWLHRIRERPAVRAALAMSRTNRPEEAFAPGPEHSRWG
jgi:glutathione S-transferase